MPAKSDPEWANAERTIVAGLVQHPQLVWSIGGWLDNRTFSVPLFQDTFEVLLYAAQHEASAGASMFDTVWTRIEKTPRTSGDIPAVTPRDLQAGTPRAGRCRRRTGDPAQCAATARDLLARDITENLRLPTGTADPAPPNQPAGPVLPDDGGPRLRP
ncbi:hypothetical protein [Micromonospora sp. NPDC049107]|uniref:hypothetical protein n=1 Tax=unclassified Micromonospora TaxID=2617518 RepID=UPI0033D88756